MGFLDSLLGRRKVGQAASNDRLFALSTAAIELDTAQGITTAGHAAIVFQPLATGDFEELVRESEELVQSQGAENGTTVRSEDDTFGYRWIVFDDPDVDDLVVAVHTVSEALNTGGYRDRTLCAVFAFTDRRGAKVHFIYNYKRGSWYPFVPAAGAQQRSNERELQLKAQIGSELPIEPELERWFPLWGAPI
jgi:hypothetical protein